MGIPLSLGLGFTITTTTDSASGAVAAGDVVLNLGYKS